MTMCNNNKKNITLMAWSTGQVSREATGLPRYIGIGSVNVVGINPTKAETKDLLGYEPDNEPVYCGTSDVDGNKVRYARVDAVIRTVPDNNNGIDYTTRLSLFVREQFRQNRDKTKMQVIDKYGRTAWVTEEEWRTKSIPTYSGGRKANIDADYRPCYVGEEDLTNFFKAFLNIPNPMIYKNNEWVPVSNLEDCQARFDNIPKLFEGDFFEIKEAWKFQSNNKVKVLFGIRTGEENRQYQTVYTGMFLRNGMTSYDRLEADVKANKDLGRFSNCEFQVVPLQEYVVEHTALEDSKPDGANPFGNPAENKFFH